MMWRIRGNKIIFWVILTGTFALASGCERAKKDERFREYAVLNPTGDFALKDQSGKIFHLKDHRGEVVLLFFGYLSCPDVCPITLSKLTRAYALLNDKRQKVLTVFVSVDPQRDSPDKIKKYLEYFNLNAVGLTGTKEEIDSVVNAYKASYEKVQTNSHLGYLINHSDYIYLLDTQGHVRYLLRPDDTAEKIVEVIQNLMRY